MLQSGPFKNIPQCCRYFTVIGIWLELHLIERWDRLVVIPRFQECHSILEMLLTWARCFHLQKAPTSDKVMISIYCFWSAGTAILDILREVWKLIRIKVLSKVGVYSIDALTNFKNLELWNQQLVRRRANIAAGETRRCRLWGFPRPRRWSSLRH